MLTTLCDLWLSDSDFKAPRCQTLSHYHGVSSQGLGLAKWLQEVFLGFTLCGLQ